MSSTRCTCLRDDAFERILHDPECPAPSHLYDQLKENTVPLTGSQKALAAFIISTLGGIITTLIVALPDNHDVQVYGGIIAGVLTVLATTLGVYQVQNTPAAPPV